MRKPIGNLLLGVAQQSADKAFQSIIPWLALCRLGQEEIGIYAPFFVGPSIQLNARTHGQLSTYRLGYWPKILLFVTNEWTGVVPVRIIGYEPKLRFVPPSAEMPYVRHRARFGKYR